MAHNELKSYIIKGGEEGRARLGVIARAMAPTTQALLDRFEPLQGALVIDAGCGGGDVTFELARRIGPDGRVIAFDLDEVKLASARRAASEQGLSNIEFRSASVLDRWDVNGASLVYVRFVLTHLQHPDAMLEQARSALAPGGVIVIEDIDYGSEFCDPPCPAYDRYGALFVQAAQRRGADPFIGRKLVRSLEGAGFSDVDSALVQPYARQGDVKHVPLLTFQAISQELVRSGVATAREIDSIAMELREYTERADTMMSWPRIFQAWGYNI